MEQFRSILVVVNEEGASSALLARAQGLAEQNGSKITFLDVIEGRQGELSRLLAGLPGPRDLETKLIETRKARLVDLAQPLRAAGIEVETRICRGISFIQAIRHVLSEGADIVLKGADQTPESQLLRGPDLNLLRQCPSPVWILNSTHEPKARKIVAAVDPDPENDARQALNHGVLRLATSLARQDGAQLHVIHAWHLADEGTLRSRSLGASSGDIAALLDKVETESALRLETLLAPYEAYRDLIRVVHVKGTPADVIAEHVETEASDTIVIGTMGRAKLAGFFVGNTTETVLNRVGCSVVAVKPEGFATPVALEEEAV
ncbi:MAG: universal stress protein [Pseudomonadota bacterium]